LDRVWDLPPAPNNLKLSRSDRLPHRQVVVEWEMPVDLSEYGQIFFVLQSRSHVGTELVETKFNRFHPHNVLSYYEDKSPNRRGYTGTVKLNPGRWYQFRVASVNAHGTRGYSTYTKPFQLSKSNEE
jgi:anosmin-1